MNRKRLELRPRKKRSSSGVEITQSSTSSICPAWICVDVTLIIKEGPLCFRHNMLPGEKTIYPIVKQLKSMKNWMPQFFDNTRYCKFLWLRCLHCDEDVRGGTQSWRFYRLLLPQVHSQNLFDADRPNDLAD